METEKKSKEIDMLSGGLSGKLILFALPLACSSIMQQLFNSADVAVVGRFAGERSLAAVGSCVALVGIFVNLLVGMSVGPNAVLANLLGQNRRDQINSVVHTVLTFGFFLGVFLMGIGMLLARVVLEVSGTPATVIDEALLYIRIYFISLPFMTVYNFGSATMRSYGDSKRPMYYLLAAGILNVILNLFLVICFHLGVAGVAIATVISNMLSASLVIHHLRKRSDEFQFSFSKMHIEKKELSRVLTIGVPAGIQEAVFSVSNVFIQSGINSFGEAAIAGSSLALNFEYFSYDVVAAFAQAAVTFVSQNYGAGNIKRCKKVFWLCLAFGMGFTTLLSTIFMIWDDFFVSIYTTSAAAATYGLVRMHRVCALEGFTALYDVESAALRGMGVSLSPSILTILGTVGFRILWLVTIFKMVPTFGMLMNVYLASWLFTGGAIAIVYWRHMRKAEAQFQ